MNRRAFLTALSGSFLAAPLAGEAAQAGSWRVGFLETSSASPARVQLLDTLRQRLRELGYVEGRTSPLSLDLERGNQTRSSDLPPSWSASRSISS